MKFTKKGIYIGLFATLYGIVAFSSFWHACAFFGLANNEWMSIILAFAFEVGQAAVLFSLLTSKKDRSRVMPWVLMTMFTLVQVVGNVFSSYKYLITNSVENLRYFKEPIFIWTDLPDDQATVIITYVVGAILPVAALLLTSMITNYLTDQSEEQKIIGTDPDGGVISEEGEDGTKIISKQGPQPPIIINNQEEFDKLYNEDKQDEQGTIKTNENKSNNDNGEQSMEDIGSETNSESEVAKNNSNVKTNAETNETNDNGEQITIELEGNKSNDKQNNENDGIVYDSNIIDNTINRKSHFINLK